MSTLTSPLETGPPAGRMFRQALRSGAAHSRGAMAEARTRLGERLNEVFGRFSDGAHAGVRGRA
jgi:hypothetical protein